MASYTSSLRLTLPVTGTESGTWGDTVNNGITTLTDTAIAGTASITMTAADYTLSSNSGSTDEARAMFITATGTPGAARNIICPAVSKLYFVYNNTTGGFAQTFKTSAGTGVSIPNGARMMLRCDGTNVVEAITQTAANTSGNATTATTATAANGLNSATTTVSVSAATAPSNGQVLMATSSTTATWQSPAGQTYPGSGIAVSTGSAWGTSLTAPSGTIVGTSDSQTLTSKTLTTPTISGTPATTAGNCGFDATAAVPTYYNGSAVMQVGYLNIPQNSQSTAYTAVLTDAGKHILHPSADTTARVFTIPANSSVAYPIGTAITFVNQASAGVVTIAITTDTMRLAGAGTTGSRTLAANGVATAVKLTATEWIISGTGLT